MVKLIPLTQDKFAKVDDEDYEDLMQFKWYAHCKHKYNLWYARTGIDNRKKLFMHRYILQLQNSAVLVDHINRDGLDNTRRNLRIASASESNMNRRKKSSPASSQFKGVCWHKQCKKWQAQIRVNGKLNYLGLFVDEIEAAKIYDDAARQSFGQFAYLNFKDRRIETV